MTTALHRRSSRNLLIGSLALVSLSGLTGCTARVSKVSGAGASFPTAIYSRWFTELAAKKGIQVIYQSVGSGAGVRQFIAQSVDFGATDAPMRPEDVAKVSRGVVQVPMTAGAIAVAYNFPGCELSLSQEQLADIFLGKINNYSQLGCGSKPIRVVHRSDASGTTFNFTAHLTAISPAWKAGPGHGNAVAWPTGVGAKGNQGVADELAQLDGGIGYVESTFVKGSLQAAALTNASGEAVQPTKAQTGIALGSIDLGPDLIGSDPNPEKGYPIVTFSWILLYKTGNGAKTDALQTAFTHTLSPEAQSIAPELGFATLPPPVAAKALAAVNLIRP